MEDLAASGPATGMADAVARASAVMITEKRIAVVIMVEFKV